MKTDTVRYEVQAYGAGSTQTVLRYQARQEAKEAYDQWRLTLPAGCDRLRLAEVTRDARGGNCYTYIEAYDK